MKRAPHGASGGALWNAASEGRMKALVTSHRTNVHTHTHAHAHAHAHNLSAVQPRHTRGPAELSFEKKKVQRE